jgi:DNA-directed RNA polymerase specialized sigma24 family protein
MLQQEMLKQLADEYQQSKDNIVFEKLLKRADRLLLSTIRKHVGRRKIYKETLRDLYHSAIIGLGRAALTTKETETPDGFIARIIAYVRLEIDLDYCCPRIPPSDKRIPMYECEYSRRSYEDGEIETRMEADNLKSLIMEGSLACGFSEVEANYLIDKMTNKISYQGIAEKQNLPYQTVHSRFVVMEAKIREWLEEKGTVL